MKSLLNEKMFKAMEYAVWSWSTEFDCQVEWVL